MISGQGHRTPEVRGLDARPRTRVQDLVMRVPHSKNAVHGSPGGGDPDDDPVHPDGAHGIREGDPRPYPEDPKPKPLLWNHQSSGTNDSRSVHEGWVVTLHPHRKNGLQTGALPPHATGGRDPPGKTDARDLDVQADDLDLAGIPGAAERGDAVPRVWEDDPSPLFQIAYPRPV